MNNPKVENLMQINDGELAELIHEISPLEALYFKRKNGKLLEVTFDFVDPEFAKDPDDGLCKAVVRMTRAWARDPALTVTALRPGETY